MIHYSFNHIMYLLALYKKYNIIIIIIINITRATEFKVLAWPFHKWLKRNLFFIRKVIFPKV